jgi:hypothetical protein
LSNKIYKSGLFLHNMSRRATKSDDISLVDRLQEPRPAAGLYTAGAFGTMALVATASSSVQAAVALGVGYAGLKLYDHVQGTTKKKQGRKKKKDESLVDRIRNRIDRSKKFLQDHSHPLELAAYAGAFFGLSELIEYSPMLKDFALPAKVVAGIGAAYASKFIPQGIEVAKDKIKRWKKGRSKKEKHKVNRIGKYAGLGALSLLALPLWSNTSERMIGHSIPVHQRITTSYTQIDYDNAKVQEKLSQGKITPEFLSAVEDMCERSDMHAMALLSVMDYETIGSFSPSIKNPKSSGRGLIQIIEENAKAMGTTTSKLASMTQIEQLPFVEEYFEMKRRRTTDYRRPADIATAVFWPIGLHTPGKTVGAVYSPSTKSRERYDVNDGVDTNFDGRISVNEYCNGSLQRGYLPEPIITPLAWGKDAASWAVDSGKHFLKKLFI